MTTPFQTPQDALAQRKGDTRPVIGCLPLYPPLELMHSMGLVPVVLWGLQEIVPHVRDADRHIQAYACSVSRRLAQFVITQGTGLLDGLFFYNACDTLRNLPEILREGQRNGQHGNSAVPLPMFQLHVPQTASPQTDVRVYLEQQIEALIQSLEETYHTSFSESAFAESVALFSHMRRLYKALDYAVSIGTIGFSDFCRTLMTANFLPVEDQIAFLEARLAASDKTFSRHGSRPRLVVSGILPPPPAICDMIDAAGFTVAGNDIAAFHRACVGMPETWQTVTDYWVQFYQYHFPCPTLLYSADRRPDAIMNLVKERNADGFVFIGEKFCEYEYFELPYIEKQLKDKGIAVLSLEIAMDDTTSLEAFRTRLEAFSELIAA